MLHCFRKNIDHIEPPKQFTWPFHYTPHKLCRMAADEVMEHIASHTEWHEELQQGKMFGVLVVRNTIGQLGFLAAFSGNLAGTNSHHVIEATFKAVARVLKTAVAIDPKLAGEIPSSKGVL